MKWLLRSSSDSYAALLAYRTTTLESGYSPDHLLFSRQLRTGLPITLEQRRPVVPDTFRCSPVQEGISRRDRRLTSTHTMVLAHFCHCPWEAPSSYQIARRLDRWSQTQPVAHTLWSRRAGNSDATDARSIPYQLLRPESSPQARRQESATQVRQRSSPSQRATSSSDNIHTAGADYRIANGT